MTRTYFLFFATLLCFGCGSKTADTKVSNTLSTDTSTRTSSDRVLFVVSNAHFYGNSDIETTNHFVEIIKAYDVFVKASYQVDFVSPEGGTVPVGYIHSSDALTQGYLYNERFMNLLEATLKPEDINPENYKAVYYPGGGSAMFTVPENETLQQISAEIYEKQKGILAAVCHGTAGIIPITLSDGSYLVADKEVNGFPDLFENTDAPYYKTFPFSIEKAVAEKGGHFSYSKEGWDGYTVADGRLVTGQDPTGAGKVAEKVVAMLKEPIPHNQ